MFTFEVIDCSIYNHDVNPMGQVSLGKFTMPLLPRVYDELNIPAGHPNLEGGAEYDALVVFAVEYDLVPDAPNYVVIVKGKFS